MAEFILKLVAVAFWAIALFCGGYGFFKMRRLRREDFRWEIDMMNERARIKQGTFTSFTVLAAFGTLAAVAAQFVK